MKYIYRKFYQQNKYFFSRIAPRIYSSFETVSRKEYKYAKLKSKLMDEYFSHDPLNGPLKYFDLKTQEWKHQTS